jgi:hypothetical protein
MPYPPDPNPGPSHRPQIPIDWNLVDKFLEADCKGTEIAGHFGMHPDTFYERVKIEKGTGFTEYASSKKGRGDALLRAAQFAKAIGNNTKGNTEMLKWLGIERLGQGKNEKNTIPPNDEQIDSSLDIIKENYALKEQVKHLLLQLQQNATKSETDPIIQRSDETV